MDVVNYIIIKFQKAATAMLFLRGKPLLVRLKIQQAAGMHVRCYKASNSFIASTNTCTLVIGMAL